MIYLLSATPYKGVNSLPMISFQTTVHEIDFSFVNTLLFTSKQAVMVTDTITKAWRNVPAIAVGSATKEKIESLGGKVIYMPKKFYGEEVAKDLISYFHDKHILYLRPKQVAFDIKGYLDEQLAKGSHKQLLFFEEVIYKTVCKQYFPKDKPPKDSAIIFTAPSTVDCFFKNFSWDESYTAIVIGESTRKHLPNVCKYVVAEEPLITSCIKKAEEITKNSDF